MRIRLPYRQAIGVGRSNNEAPNRTDLVAPATGHKDCVRDDKGFIVSVPGFIGK